MEISIQKSEFYRQVNAQLGKMDYRKLYKAYSGSIRKSQVEPRILFEILVCAYMLGVYTSRGIERLCRENVQFILILDRHAAPDHCTISRFRSGKKTQEAYIKPQNYESRKTKKFREQIGRAENMAYYEPKDYFVCKNERILERVSTAEEKTKDGTTREVAYYRCEDCRNCPHRTACCKAKDTEKPKEIMICWERAAYREAALERISSEEGKLLRANRSVQVEGAFGELKNNRGFTRFLTCGIRNVTTELYLHAMAQNLLKYLAKCNRKQPKAHLMKPKSLLKF